MDGVAPIQELLDPVFPYLRPQVPQVSLLVNPNAASADGLPPAPRWNFDDGGRFDLELSPDTATLSVGPQYEGFSEFSDRFQAVVSALARGAGVTRAYRLGIRYVNIAEIPSGDVTAWRTWFSPELMGWLAIENGVDDTQPITTVTQTHLSAPPQRELALPGSDIQAIVRHGLVLPTTTVPGVSPMHRRGPAYLLDIDVFADGPQRFEPNQLSKQFAKLHDWIEGFFFWAVTDSGAAYFGREVLE